MDSHPKVNPAIQGLDVMVEVDGKPVRAIIPRVVFEESFQCRVGPSAWPQAYRDRAETIDEIVRKRFATKKPDFVVLRSSDFA